MVYQAISGADSVVSAQPPGRLLYLPFVAPGSDAPAGDFSGIFSDGELLEFQHALPDRAIANYQHLAESKNPAVRAGALMRIARVQRKTGRGKQALAVYRQLADVNANLARVPAELVARHALCELAANKTEADELRRDLLQSRWPLTRGQFGFYWSEAARLSGNHDPPPAGAVALTEAVARGWGELTGDRSPRGQTTLWVDGQPFFLIWRGVTGRKAVSIARPEAILKQIFAGQSVLWAALDGEGRTVAGHKDGTERAAVRTPAETQLPWTLYLTSAPGPAETGMLIRQRFLLLVTGVMVLFLIAGAYFIARAIRGDLAVARMQSDFVAAVSHEFRSPLTSIRQLSEILALGRIPNEARRQIYYETLVSETTRLQRLVEGLLNFGRMEAGVRQYRFQTLDAAALVAQIAAEFELQIAGSGRHIVLEGESKEQCPCRIDADPEALSVALRNLVDNALKYSPNCPSVWVQWGLEIGHVAIRVRDRGLGIKDSEKRAIFRKFVRGSAAEAANVRGSGVGLAMVRHIVAAHGGNITVASVPGSGSIFTMLLPVSIQPAELPSLSVVRGFTERTERI